MDKDMKNLHHDIANTVRALSMDAIEKANSGHPGLPMGCAELASILWGNFMHYNPKNPDWFNRDHFVLSAGHGSMLLYSMLHLTGYDLSIDDLKLFRQLNSKTPGHPEKLDTPGVEVTTGPLGQGVANAVGIALSYKMLEARFNREGYPIVNNKIICLAGDGCMMEGVSSEASSLAGHLCLDNLILLYDMNYITLDGEWKDSCSDNQIMRYESYGWEVIKIEDANDLDQIESVMNKLRGTQTRPTLVICHTVIGKGSPHKQGTHKAHGSPLGKDEVRETKEALGISQEPFYVPAAVRDFFRDKMEKCKREEDKWNDLFKRWKEAHPDLYKLWQQMESQEIPQAAIDEILAMPVDEKVAGRKVSQGVIQILAKHCPFLIGGSADLSESDYTWIKDSPAVSSGCFGGRNIKCGIREFAMTAIANGMSITFFRLFIGTFFTFSDYGRNAVRLGCLSEHPTLLIYTHDSIGMGEDGPTHQPVEQLASLRAMPGMHLFRPGDAHEVKGAWIWAIKHRLGPVALVLSRQNIPTLKETERDFEKNVAHGGYILIEEDKSREIDYTFIATGSELSLAVEVAGRLKQPKFGKNVRVVSMPSFHLFEEQPCDYKKRVLGGAIGIRVSIEAGSSFGWERYIGLDGIAISIDTFGKSAPFAEVMHHFGFTADQILDRVLTAKPCNKH